MSLVARARAMAGESQAVFAERVGTSRTRLSAYENGRTFPELDTLERVARAAGAELALAPIGTQRVAEQFVRIHDAVAARDTAWALRLVAELIDWVRTGVVSVDSLDLDPGLCGDVRWDALVGGVVEMLRLEAGEPVPAWASGPGRSVEGVWFFSGLRSLWPHIFVATPAALAARGVFVSADSLASV